MAIPESQLNDWSSPGSTGVFRDTYNHLKDTLEDKDSPYAKASKEFRVFLQGSYENDTNVHGDSDVDTVIMLTSSFHYSMEGLTDQERVNFRAAYPNDATYALPNFRADVLAWLEHNYRGFVKPKNKAVQILRNGRLPREADVLICLEYKNYWAFANPQDTSSYIGGVRFSDQYGTAIINYPELHSKYCSDKHLETGDQFKFIARIFKNMRNRMIKDNLLAKGVAPSYYIESLLTNVPQPNFVGRYDATVRNCLIWLRDCDRTALRCAHRMSPLVGDNSPTAWPLADCNAFIMGLINFWDNWR